MTHADIEEVSHGRGGAGNILPDDTPYGDGEIVHDGATTAHGEHSAGRGGAGNIESLGSGDAQQKHGHTDVVPEAAVVRPSTENYHVGVRNPLKPRCPECFAICDPPHYPPLLLSKPPPSSSSTTNTTCTCAHKNHDPTSSSPPTMSAVEQLELDLRARKHKKQESMARREITKLIQPVSVQRGGQGNVHKEEPPVTVHEGLADKLKNKMLGRNKKK